MKYRAVSDHLSKSRSRSEVASFFMSPVHFPEFVMDVLIEKHACKRELPSPSGQIQKRLF
jgi:hypothetical protein